MTQGRIVAGALAPHPPHLIYAENPPQNEPRAECGWETLRWGYERLRRDLAALELDVIVVLSPHWQTYVGTHLLGVPAFKSLSVDPIFPHLFRYHYELTVDVELAEAVHDAGRAAGLEMKMMRNPDFRVDYGTIVSCHLVRPDWALPIVSISSNRASSYYNVDVMQEQAKALGRATAEAIRASGRRALLLSSCSLSHRHFVTESELPEDMSREHITHHGLYLWDMELLRMIRSGRTRELVDVMPEFIAQAIGETDSGALTWLLSALDYPEVPGEVYAYGTVIGTGNAVVGWLPEEARR
ncbi:MAG: tRNA U-34 5-methylaminomethyl-2-thiouridine biosynthesis protein [Myxococcales bacterium]|nr:tRNA U-34 5-methylaminomethyl-2-thiouridine biosynthesis protein [Myxococcales bacterium]MCB9751016.1 tRNA U-34 5-methylaminomethyl-2-thiouridine biosynthesis protein [Myxococcales bacterium]